MAKKKITLMVTDEAHARLLALSKRPGAAAAFERALATIDGDSNPDGSDAFAREQAEIKASTRARIAAMASNPEGAQGREEEALIAEEAERALNDEIAEEEMGEAEKEEHERLKKQGKPNPLLKRWASKGR